MRKNYDAANDRFATTWAEISVAARRVTGQGPGHVAWARAQQSWWPFGKREDSSKGLAIRFDERRISCGATIRRPMKPRRNFKPPPLRKEVETCGLCHARRSEFSEEWVPGRRLSDTHVVSLLAAVSITPTDKCRTRSTITARSSRAGCCARASPAAIAMIRTPPNSARLATACACSVTRRRNMR